MDEKVQYWVDIAEYDLDTAKSMLKSKRYIYVGFMCHQAIEKILKAYWQFTNNHIPPKTHNLSYLAKETGLNELFTEEQIDFIDEIEPLNIETRYPVYRDELMKKLNREYSKNILKKSSELFKWIKSKL